MLTTVGLGTASDPAAEIIVVALDTVSCLWSNSRMKTGAEQLTDWMERRGLSNTEAAAHFEWDLTFISKLVNGHRLPGLANAIKIERETGIPVEAWMPSKLDSDGETAGVGRSKRK